MRKDQSALRCDVTKQSIEYGSILAPGDRIDPHLYGVKPQ